MIENSNVLIVGGAGFVGSNLGKIILASDTSNTVTVVDNLLSSEKQNLSSSDNLTFIEGSITDDIVLLNIKDDFDYIFQLATFHGNQSSIFDPVQDLENNTMTSVKLLDHIKGFKKLRKYVYSSAGCSVAKKTYGDAEATTEEDPITLDQDSPYSISKISGEFYCVYFHKQFGVPTVRARFQNVYGPGEVLGAGRWRGTNATVWRNVVPIFVYRSIHNLDLPLHNGGDSTRDFIFVEDICRGLIACAAKGALGDVYNLASGGEVSIKELADSICDEVKSESVIELLPKRDWDTSGKRFGNNEKAKQELAFECAVSFEEGIKKTVAWTKENMDFIELCMAKHKDQMN
ncbi:MAG: UDP-glucose 4-epimerase [Parvicellaceae bacterium]|jgi:UDP-glucose 4-epimerase